MAKVKEMLDTHLRSFDLETRVLEAAIEALIECANTYTQRADVCTATGRVVSRRTECDADLTRAQLEACVAVCKTCGDECEPHGEHLVHCRVCAESCRGCEQACRDLIAAMA